MGGRGSGAGIDLPGPSIFLGVDHTAQQDKDRQMHRRYYTVKYSDTSYSDEFVASVRVALEENVATGVLKLIWAKRSLRSTPFL